MNRMALVHQNSGAIGYTHSREEGPRDISRVSGNLLGIIDRPQSQFDSYLRNCESHSQAGMASLEQPDVFYLEDCRTTKRWILDPMVILIK